VKFNHTNAMKDNDKPEAPEGYTSTLGSSIPDVLPEGSLCYNSAGWAPSLYAGKVASQTSWYAVPNAKPSQSIAEEAAAVVAGDRAAGYGDVNEYFGRIAKLWSAYTGSSISPWDVAQMMILLKVSRAKTSTKRDTLVDIIGYAECAEQLGKTKT